MRPKLTYANVMATIAVFIALGGASYAALKLPKNSVGTKQLKKNSVNSVKVKDHSLRAADFKAGQLPAGKQGPKGDPGVKGDPGTPGPGFGPDSGSAYELATIADATIVGGADISFSGSNDFGANLHHTNGTTTFTVSTAGRYEISWVVNHTVGVGSAIAIAVNGTVVPVTNHNTLTAVGSEPGEATLSLAGGAVLTVRNNSAVPMTLDLAPGVGAVLTIQRIS
jgi:BclA C-terminal domain